MSRIHEIPVVVVGKPVTPTPPAGPTTAAMLAILNEIDAKLEALVAEGQESTIDLRWLLGTPLDLGLLRQTLGEGEVSATIQTVGTTVVRETAVPCVWWISHRDREDGTLGEYVEITEVPEILRSDRLSITRGVAELRERCAVLQASDPVSSVSSMSSTQGSQL
jgi:hydrogenase-1 operon protein HyaF